EVLRVATRDLFRRIGAPAVDDDDLIGPADALEHPPQQAFLVERDQEHAQPGPSPAHSAIASSSAVCRARRPSQKSSICERHEKPGATTSASSSSRTAGKSTRSPAALETS